MDSGKHLYPLEFTVFSTAPFPLLFLFLLLFLHFLLPFIYSKQTVHGLMSFWVLILSICPTLRVSRSRILKKMSLFSTFITMCFEETKTKLLNIWINVIWFVECWHRDSRLTWEDIIKDFFQRETVARCNDGAKESPWYEEGTLSMKCQGLVQQKNSRFFSGQRVVWSLRGHITHSPWHERPASPARHRGGTLLSSPCLLQGTPWIF